MKIMKDKWGKIAVTVLRMAIGWHFLYEGFVKLAAGEWSSYSYLVNATGPFPGFYHWLASAPALVNVVDFLNVWGLILAGLALFLGILTSVAIVGGILLLLLYYFAYPPFGSGLISNVSGQFYIIDRNFLEALTLLLLLTLREKGYGLYALPFLRKRSIGEGGASLPGRGTSPAPGDAGADPSRREMVKNLVSLPLLGVMGWGASAMTRKFGVDTLSGATIQLKHSDLRKLEGELPAGKIGNHTISRLVMGGNLIGGWAHSRDLLYVPSLFRAYNTEKKVFETLILAEKAGINTINIGYASNTLLAKYKKLTGSSLKVISQVAPNMEKGDFFEQINGAIDAGADILQVQGNWCDWLVRDGRPEVIAGMLERIRNQGYTAGLGAHTVDSLIACEKLGILPDYYMQTMHHDNYWSAHPRENRVPFEVDGKKNPEHDRFHDNCFCLFPDRTVEFVNRVKIPVMGFKVLAAGAIAPEDGFRWAFENGADFICVGMFDFQVVDDVNTVVAILNNIPARKREWYA
ncbi:MAG: hypothetical protein WBK43_02410 [Prolixibacteraceae bacterium]|jgi:uncharacterized membrane protein YphA (DoxX/SURF4 family)|nr:DoxX family protein [Prolixibacteraceae bacterium]MDI9563440.1 hypothetical protein [Bacteroidota bacterium]HOG96235.1 hypothetical protein [Prolixibacteraceae bacterium]HQH76540.1 hypothetical protein [Prolixibacteraceae bacterium]HQL19510.1 hypothetical protein [Prolixibacteraceae bacterium]